MRRKTSLHGLFLALSILQACGGGSDPTPAVTPAGGWEAKRLKDDVLLRMPGTQLWQGVALEGPHRCLNCHGGYDEAVEPGFNWKGSMMAQSARDPIFWASMTVAGQDSIFALGNPNAQDLCQRCHFPEGWLGGHSEPPNASSMMGSDFDGIHCDFCHVMWDPFFETTFGPRESDDPEYWDEATSLSPERAAVTAEEDASLLEAMTFFNGSPFFSGNVPFSATYTENTGGQYFISSRSQKRGGFADARGPHGILYSRYHKSKHYCASCHDVSNPALANLGQDGSEPLTSEVIPAYAYFHVERSWSEFASSAYGRPGGAATNPELREQGLAQVTWVTTCQDCHMPDVVAAGARGERAPIRPDESEEHPHSGHPLHDLTGGNIWVTHILASLDPAGPVHDPENARILDRGTEALTLDLDAGETPRLNGAALEAGSDRSRRQLRMAATLKDPSYDPATGRLAFTVLNNTGHKVPSGFPEGRRAFVNIRAYAGGALIHEVNPYDDTVGTLKGDPFYPTAPPLDADEAYVGEIVYEARYQSDLTGEHDSFHLVMATGRSKDNRLPPKGFDVVEAAKRLADPVWEGASAPGFFTTEELAGGYDAVELQIVPGAERVEVRLYYQGTTREYIEFLRDEINGVQNLTLPGGDATYIVQSDPYFEGLRAWGNVVWDLWEHNHGLGATPPANGPVEGIVPFLMAQATFSP